MIVPPPNPGFKTYTRLTYVHAIEVSLSMFRDDMPNGIWMGPYPLPCCVTEMDDYGLNPASRRMERFKSYWAHNRLTQESWRLKDEDYVVVDAMDPRNVMVMSRGEFQTQYSIFKEKEV